MPKIFDYRIAPRIAEAVARAAIETGEARGEVDPAHIAENTRRYVYEGQWPVPPPSGKKQSLAEESLELHRRYQGVLQIKNKIAIRDNYILGQFYLPPLAEGPARLIRENPELAYDYTAKGNLVAIVTDGSAVLGLGNIGARAAMPVMEGKAILFQTFGRGGGLSHLPLHPGCGRNRGNRQAAGADLRRDQPGGHLGPPMFLHRAAPEGRDEHPGFSRRPARHGHRGRGGFDQRHEDLQSKTERSQGRRQRGRGGGHCRSKLLLEIGVWRKSSSATTHGAIYRGRPEGMNWIKEEMAEHDQSGKQSRGPGPGGPAGRSLHRPFGGRRLDARKWSVPWPGIRSFCPGQPNPEILPDPAKEAGAMVVATGRSDFPNQVNNSLVFPGVFRGALDVRARVINEPMKIAAARAIADLVPEKDLGPEYIIPKSMDFRVPARGGRRRGPQRHRDRGGPPAPGSRIHRPADAHPDLRGRPGPHDRRPTGAGKCQVG